MALSQLSHTIATAQLQLLSNQQLQALIKAFQLLATNYPTGNWVPIATKIHFSLFTQLDVSPETAYQELLLVGPILIEEFKLRKSKEDGK